jgi:hypothetical protein
MQSAIKEWNGHVGPVLDAKNGFDIIDCEICMYGRRESNELTN